MNNAFYIKCLGLIFLNLVVSCAKEKVPTVSTVLTAEVDKITITSAICGGKITDEGSGTVISRGVCWSTEYEPTIDDNKTTDGEGVVTFSSTISDLIAETTYYVRAYATNSAGTGYGVERRFKTYDTEAITDIDGNYYNTVTISSQVRKAENAIGSQVWIAENLRVTKYSDGTDIPLVTDNSEWWNLSTGAYCWYDNDYDIYGRVYGALYNQYAVSTKKLCPLGWHVPTLEEWQDM
jgi:hypothetical protein